MSRTSVVFKKDIGSWHAGEARQARRDSGSGHWMDMPKAPMRLGRNRCRIPMQAINSRAPASIKAMSHPFGLRIQLAKGSSLARDRAMCLNRLIPIVSFLVVLAKE